MIVQNKIGFISRTTEALYVKMHPYPSAPPHFFNCLESVTQDHNNSSNATVSNAYNSFNKQTNKQLQETDAKNTVVFGCKIWD